jgi:RimJ/RimL family protein N-acetyltransferase
MGPLEPRSGEKQAPDWSRPPRPEEAAPGFAAYLAQVPAGQLRHLLERQRTAWLRLAALPESAWEPYAAGKWSLCQLAGHLADTERVLRARMLRAARGDTTALPGFDEDAWVAAAAFDARPLGTWLRAFDRERGALLADLDEIEAAAFNRGGEANGHPFRAGALPWVLAGHVAHHLQVLRERYLQPRDLDPWRPLCLEAGGGLVLEEAREERAAALFARIDAERGRLGAWLPWVAGTLRAEDTAAFLRSSERGWALGTDHVFVLVVDGAALGMIGLHGLRGGCGEIGYWICAAGEGRGFVTAAVRAVLRWAEAERGLLRTVIRCEPANGRSRGLPLRLGFREEGLQRAGAGGWPGRARDVIVYSRIAGEDPPLD